MADTLIKLENTRIMPAKGLLILSAKLIYIFADLAFLGGFHI